MLYILIHLIESLDYALTDGPNSQSNIVTSSLGFCTRAPCAATAGTDCEETPNPKCKISRMIRRSLYGDVHSG